MAEMSLRDWPAYTAHFQLPLRYLVRDGRSDSAGTVILLHGYQDHALSMTRRMGWLERPDLPFQILAINAPFPVPVWKTDGFVEAYSWYFRDTSRDLMIVNPLDTAAEVANLIKQVLPSDRKIALFGFSQGGYLAPYLARHLQNVRSIIAVGSGYPPEAYAALSPEQLTVFGLHGEYDDRWPTQSSVDAHKRLLTKGFRGEFHTIPGLDHRVDPMLEPYILRFVNEAFGGS